MTLLKELKYFTMAMLLCCFISAGALTSCRDEKKKENTEEQAEHPEGSEHPTDEGEDEGEHPSGGEHPEGGEHPAKDSVSG